MKIMTGPNVGENSENIESSNNASQNSANKYGKLIKSYVSKKLGSKSDRLSFAKKIQSAKKIPDNILSELEAHKAVSSEFSGLEINAENIELGSMKREVGSFLAENHSQKMTLRSILLQEYDISPQEYTKYILGAVDDIYSEDELRKLLDSDQMRDTFLAGIYKKNTPKRRLVAHILQDLKIEDRFDKLESHLQQGFMNTVSKIQRRQSLEIEDIMNLFESNILSVTEKQKVLETFMPSISITDARKLNIISQNDAKAIKKKALESSLDGGWFGGVNLDNYIENINDDELIFSTQGIFNSATSQGRLFEQNFFFEKFKTDFDAMLAKIETDLASKSIQTAKEMQEILSGVNYISGIDKFREGATMVVTSEQKDEAGNTVAVQLYADIILLASAGTFIIRERGVGRYDSSITKDSRQTYSQFIDYATKGNIPKKIDIISPDTLKHKIQTGEIKDMDDNGGFQDRSKIKAERNQIAKKIEERENELRKQGVPKSQWDRDPELQELFTTQEEKNKVLGNLEENNKKSLQNAIDEIDSSGKDFNIGFGTTFITKEGKGHAFSITHIDETNQTITVRGLEKDETVSYSEFIEQFKSQKATRVSKIANFSELFTQTDDAYKPWQGFELDNNTIKNKNSKVKVEYEYLVPPAGGKDEMIKIHDISGDKVTISFGEVKDKKKFDKKEGKEKKAGEIFSVESKEYTVGIGVLDHYIRKNKLNFRSLEEGKVAEEEMKGIPKPEEKFGFGSWFFQGMSLAAAIKGGKTAIEQITNMLNEGDDEKANQFALKVFGPLLGQDGKTEFQARVEQTQKKNMDEFIDKLKGINSGIATEMILNWLKDPRTPEYKKEAGMFYMFEKYGALCAKRLYDYQGQYFWYQKMGGRIGDEVWVKVHAENDKEPKQNTTEEQLVYMLMKSQTRPGGFNGVQRRSKLDKELKAMRGKGKEEEYATGQKDGGAERDIQDRLTGGLSELDSGNYPNAMGWLETVVDKGGTMKQMNMIPFVAMFSGMAYNFEKDILDKMKNFPGDSRMLMMLRMMSYHGDIELVNSTIMEACVRLDDRGYPGIAAEAKAIFDNRFAKTDEREKQKATIAFYEKYGEVLTNILYMLNTGDKDDVHNKMIFFEKDDSSTFSNYYDKIQGYVNADGDFGKNETLMADSFAGAGTSGIDIYRATKQMLELRTGGAWAKHESGPIMWKEIMHEFESIPKRQYDPDPVKNEKMQRKLLDSNLRKFLSAIVSLNTDTRVSTSYNTPTGFFNRLNDWGVYFDDLIDAGANAEAIKGGHHKELIDGFIDGIMNYSNGGASRERPTKADGNGGFKYTKDGETDETTTVSDLIQGKAMGTLNQVDTLKQSISPEGLSGFSDNGSSKSDTSERLDELLDS